MRRAADAGHTQAAFNVAVMLNSGRGAPRDLAQAAIWYARAAAGAAGAPPLTSGSSMRAATACLRMSTCLAPGTPPRGSRRPAILWPRPNLRLTGQRIFRPRSRFFPLKESSLEPGLQNVELVWTSPLEPEAVRFFVELRILDARASREAWSGFVDVSSVRLPLPPGARILAWRVSAVARGSANYAVSGWSIFTVPPS